MNRFLRIGRILLVGWLLGVGGCGDNSPPTDPESVKKEEKQLQDMRNREMNNR